MNRKILLTILLCLAACTPAIQGSLKETYVSPPTWTATAIQPFATPTDIQLPFNDKSVENEYCQIPAVKLPTAAAQGLSEDEIAGELMELLLAHFYTPEAPDYCQIDGYRIEKIYYDERTPDLPLEPKGDFMRVVMFSIQLTQVPNMWMSWAGEIDQQNWLHTGNSVAVFHAPDGYTMKFAFP